MRKIWIILLCLCGVSTLSAQETLSEQELRQENLQQFQKLAQVYRYLMGLYVDDVEMKPVVEGAIRGMLEELDPHSAYLDAEEMRGVTESFEGEFSGIGVEFNVLRDTIIVVNTIAGGPAERVGVRANDRIVRIDTLQAVGMTRTEVPKHLRGKTGTKVEIDVVRHGTPGQLHFVIVRDRIPLNTVDAAYRVGDDIGYIKVNRFGHTTMDEFREGYRKMGRPQKMILDLRGNGGGLLEQAIEMAGFFLPRGATIVSTEGRAIPASSFRAQANGEDLTGGLVVLIDESSASASEIVSGAIQDWDRGVIIAQLRKGARAAADRTLGRLGRAHHRGPLPYPLGSRHPAPLRKRKTPRILPRPSAPLRRRGAGFARRPGSGIPYAPHRPHRLRRRRNPSRHPRRGRYDRLFGLLCRIDSPGCCGRIR